MTGHFRSHRPFNLVIRQCVGCFLARHRLPQNPRNQVDVLFFCEERIGRLRAFRNQFGSLSDAAEAAHNFFGQLFETESRFDCVFRFRFGHDVPMKKGRA